MISTIDSLQLGKQQSKVLIIRAKMSKLICLICLFRFIVIAKDNLQYPLENLKLSIRHLCRLLK